MESRLERIRAAGPPVLGPTLDAQIRRIDARIGQGERAEFNALIETWPVAENGDPADPYALQDALAALGARSARLPGGSVRGAMLGLLLGAGVGLVSGFVAYLMLLAMRWDSEALAWGVTLAAVVLCGGLGFRQGRRPTRGGRAAWAGFCGFLLGALLGGPAIGALALVAGSVLGVSQREGAFAMGVVFVIAPMGAILVGLGVGVWRGLRAWRR